MPGRRANSAAWPWEPHERSRTEACAVLLHFDELGPKGLEGRRGGGAANRSGGDSEGALLLGSCCWMCYGHTRRPAARQGPSCMRRRLGRALR
eukprot:256517-Chlamydomonas_euryale.AAC.2